jgi:hypothetical protein
MGKVKPNLADQQMITQVAARALKEPGYEAEPGQCKRWVRQVLEGVKDPYIITPPPGLDAWQTFNWYKENHPECVVEAPGVAGDLLFKDTRSGDGHGHVAIRLFGNRTAENYSPAAKSNGGDARTSRSLTEFGRIDGCVRPYGH